MAVQGTMTSSLPPACRQAGTCRGSGARYVFRPPERSYLDALTSSPASVSSIALSVSVTFCVTSRSSQIPGMCRSIRTVFSGMVPSPGFQSRFFVLANERTVRRTRGHAFHVRIENPKRARVRTLSVFIPELRYLQFNSASGINEIKSKTLHSPNHPQQEIHQSIHQLEGCNTARATLRSSD